MLRIGARTVGSLYGGLQKKKFDVHFNKFVRQLMLRAEAERLRNNFAAYKKSREEVNLIEMKSNQFALPQLEDPFVLRKALDVTRSQLWAIQERLELQGEGGQSRQLTNT